MKNKGGRPPYVPTQKDRDVVLVMAGHNIAQEKICAALGINEKTLRKHFKKELSSAAAQVEAQLVANMFALAKGKDGTAFRATAFLLHCRFHWTQYAPPPARQGEPEMGKKEALNQAAQTGHEETTWGDVLH